VTDPTSVPGAGAGELDSLLGAYALDALDPFERSRVDAYLNGNAAARGEVDEMRETAAALALLPDTPMEAPPELWARISETIASDRAQARDAEREPEPSDELAARRRTRARWVAPAAVAAAIAVVVLAVQVVAWRDRDDADRIGPSAVAAAYLQATSVDGARETGLQASNGATLARVVLLPDGTGYLRGDDLRPLPDDETYQLWALTGSADDPVAISAGVLGSDPQAIGFRASGPVNGFALTVEQAGGVVSSEQQPVAAGSLS
jgi:anti-sigma-K factor RskA